MIIAIDFDGTIVKQDRAYDDLTSRLEFMPGAKHGLLALKAAGHILVLWSGRLSRSLLVDPLLDPLVKSGKRRVNLKEWKEKSLPLHRARAKQMLEFIDANLPKVFDAIDDGQAGKPNVDLFIDDKALRLGFGPQSVGWDYVAHVYGQTMRAQ